MTKVSTGGVRRLNLRKLKDPIHMETAIKIPLFIVEEES